MSVFFPFKENFVVVLVDCKLVRYCNIDVFLLVSHFLVFLYSTEICTELDKDGCLVCQEQLRVLILAAFEL